MTLDDYFPEAFPNWMMAAQESSLRTYPLVHARNSRSGQIGVMVADREAKVQRLAKVFMRNLHPLLVLKNAHYYGQYGTVSRLIAGIFNCLGRNQCLCRRFLMILYLLTDLVIRGK